MKSLTNKIITILAITNLYSCTPQKMFVKTSEYNVISLEEARKIQYVEVNIQPTDPETKKFCAITYFKNGSKYTKEYLSQIDLFAEVEDSIKKSYPNTEVAIINERYRGRWTLGILAKRFGINNLAFHDN